jgi:signal transduction histidine kinase
LEVEDLLLRRACDQARLLMAVMSGPDFVYTYLNDCYHEAIGRRDVLGKPIGVALPELVGQGILDLLEGVYKTGVPFEGREFPVELQRHGALDTRYFTFVYDAVRGADGAIAAVMVTGHDVTDEVLAKRAASALTLQLEQRNRLVEALVAERTQALSIANEQLMARTQELEITQRRLHEQMRQVDQQRVFAESIIQNVPTGIAYLDRDLIFRVSNPVYSAFLQLPPERIVDRYLFDIVSESEDQILPFLREVLETGEPHYERNFPFVYRTAEGQVRETFWDFVYYPAILSPGGEVDGILVLADEISARVEQENERNRLQHEYIAALEQNDQMKDQFLGILSHELRTPLNAIQGFGSILADGVAGDLQPGQTTYLRKMLDSSENMLKLVNDLLDMSRVQAGRFSLDRQVVALAPLLGSVLASLSPEAAHKGHTLANELLPSLPDVLADPQRLSQVLSNLVTNAIKYTPPGGTITVRAFADGAVLRVEVADTGDGVPPDQQSRIFDAFTQVDMTSTRKSGGVGLGLSIVKALVEAHGGVVGVRSDGAGRGSTFFFTVPLAA